MAYQVINIDGDQASFTRYGKELTAALKQLEARFPEDVECMSLGMAMYTGECTPWLILDEAGNFVSFCVTRDNRNEATGIFTVTLTSHAGAEGLACCADMCAVIEQWAFDRGAHFTAAEGRRGWGKALKRHGYIEHVTVWRKPRPEVREAA